MDRGESSLFRFDGSLFFDFLADDEDFNDEDNFSFLRLLESFRRCRSTRSCFSISTGSYFITKLSRLFKNLARAANSGYPSVSNAHSSFHAMRLRPVLVLSHELSKLRGEQ